VRASDLHKFAFCPRRFFFDMVFQAKPPLSSRLRMMLGKLLHFFHHVFRLRWRREELLKAYVEELDLHLVGKPDCFKDCGEYILLEEFKSGRAPRSNTHPAVVNGAWRSDFIQLQAYAYILRKTFGKPVKMQLRYVDRTVEVSEDATLLMETLSHFKSVVEDLVFPDPYYVGGNCAKCTYQQVCQQLRESLHAEV